MPWVQLPGGCAGGARLRATGKGGAASSGAGIRCGLVARSPVRQVCSEVVRAAFLLQVCRIPAMFCRGLDGTVGLDRGLVCGRLKPGQRTALRGYRAGSKGAWSMDEVQERRILRARLSGAAGTALLAAVVVVGFGVKADLPLWAVVALTLLTAGPMRLDRGAAGPPARPPRTSPGARGDGGRHLYGPTSVHRAHPARGT